MTFLSIVRKEQISVGDIHMRKQLLIHSWFLIVLKYLCKSYFIKQKIKKIKNFFQYKPCRDVDDKSSWIVLVFRCEVFWLSSWNLTWFDDRLNVWCWCSCASVGVAVILSNTRTINLRVINKQINSKKCYPFSVISYAVLFFFLPFLVYLIIE